MSLQKDRAIALSSVLDTALLERMIESGYILRNRHPHDDELQILCYTTLAQVEGKWNDATKAARGLIVRGSSFDDAILVQRPWEKFFTLSQMDNKWHLGDEENESSAEDSFASLNFQAPAAVYDKMDGSLGILYRDPRGLPAFATKGSFISDQATMFTRMLQANENALTASDEILSKDDTTALFELVGPGNRIVLAYEKNELVLLGGVEKKTGAHVNPEDIESWGARELPIVERMEAATLEEALAIPARENREGVVVSVGGSNPMKIKIKQDDYVKLHRLVTFFSPREARNLVMNLDASYEDLLALSSSRNIEQFDDIKNVLNIEGFKKGEDSYEFIRSKRESAFKKMLLPRAEAIADAHRRIAELDESWFTGDNPPKRFAAHVKTLPGDPSTLFALYRARLNNQPLSSIPATHELRKAIKNAKQTDD